MSELEADVERIYEEGHELAVMRNVEGYHDRHGTGSLIILTIYDKATAESVAEGLRRFIEGKVVAEIGAGVGLLAVEMARHAKRVFAIESDPAWSWTFCKHLYRDKPENLTWIFGTAESVADWLRCEVAIIVTRSGHKAMQDVGERIADHVLDVIEDWNL